MDNKKKVRNMLLYLGIPILIILALAFFLQLERYRITKNIRA